MTSTEAQHYLNLSPDGFDSEMLNDRYQEMLFEHKLFFNTVVPISKVVFARTTKMKKELLAFSVLGLKGIENQEVFDELCADFSERMEEAFHDYQRLKNKVKLKVMHANSYESIFKCAHFLVDLQLKYAAKWQCSIQTDQVIVTKEPDSMELLSQIKKYTGITFVNLKSMKDNPSELLIHEMKRLSLIYTNYNT